jgi:GT2 family glycosyltransferase
MTSVLVGIPTLNGPDRLTRCLESIAQCTRLSAFESVKVLVCDDGSREDQLKLNKDAVSRASRRLPGLEMLVSETRCGIAASWNKLVRHQSTDAVVLVNDDIEVVDYWLDVLVYSVTENRVAGMVALNSYAGVTKGQVQAAGRAPLRRDYFESKLLHAGGNLLAASGSIFAFRRDTYDAVGGFDERYFCFYEEVDFGVAMKMIGLVHFVADAPVVYHMGGATTSDACNLVASEEMVRSRQEFRKKWGKTPAELRAQFANAMSHLSRLHEWSTQLATFTD